MPSILPTSPDDFAEFQKMYTLEFGRADFSLLKNEAGDFVKPLQYADSKLQQNWFIWNLVVGGTKVTSVAAPRAMLEKLTLLNHVKALPFSYVTTDSVGGSLIEGHAHEPGLTRIAKTLCAPSAPGNSMDGNVVNYIVRTRGSSGFKETKCETLEEAWRAYSDCSLGVLRMVSSPTGQSVRDFIPL